ncbi:DUF4189 domain-containing protein [Luteibacter sahnii]|uniref:DUF4189 domain-containing protein n=1 Tax=Luteibacter sahnii TaxID=3021977 RepID=UPI0034E0DC88
MKFLAICFLVAATVPGSVYAQCAPGIPGAGNPGCIPPSAPNSPYNQGGDTPVNSEPQGRWEDRWGSVAIDPILGIPGSSEHMASSAAAVRSALEQCRSKGGKDCAEVLTYHNQCVAVAQGRSGGQVQAASAATVDKAAVNAISRCGGSNRCVVRYQSCSYQERVD